MSDKESGSDNRNSSLASFDRRRVLQLAGAGAFGSTTLVSEAIAANGNLNVDVRQIVARTDPKFPTVRVYASVTDSNGNPITSLSSGAFSLAEDGATQSIESLTAPESSNISDVSVSIVIDRSGSMTDGTKINDARAAAKDFVQQFQDEDEGQVIAFNDTIEFKERWSKDESELSGAIDTISAGGGTDLWGATVTGVDQAAPRVGRSAVVVLTDGKDGGSTTLNEAITAAQESNVPVYTIGLGSDAVESDLQTLANDTGGTYHFAPDSSDLATIYDRISQSIADEYEITYETTNNATDGTIRDVTVTANYNGDSGSDTGTYEAPCAPLPTARFDDPPTSAVIGQPISFDASPSTANGGSLVKYLWDFDNNGVTDATGEQATHTYTSTGTYEARLTVEKMCGARDVAVTEEFTVTQGNYDLSITSVNDPINAGETLQVEATVTNISNETRTDVVALYDFDDNQITPAASIHLGAGETTDVTLEWETEASDAGTDDVTIQVGSVTVEKEVEIQSVNIQLSATTGGANGVAPGGRKRIDVELTNAGGNTLENFQFGIDIDSLPNEWTIIDSIESDNYNLLDWDNNEAIWTANELLSGQTVEASIVIEVPKSASVGLAESIVVLYRPQNGADSQATAEVEVEIVDRFDPTVHGFGFPNWYTNTRPDHNHSIPSKSEMEDVVRDTIIPDLDDLGVITPFGIETALTSVLYPLVNSGSATNGHCYGITYASDEYYHNPNAIPVSGVTVASEITEPNMTGQDVVGSDIDFYHNVQYLNTEPIIAMLILQHAQGLIDYDTVLNEIKYDIDQTGTAPIALANDDGSALHQVLAYDYEVNDNLTNVYLYDSSSPLDHILSPYSHWRWERYENGDTLDEYRETKLTFDTSGDSVEFAQDYTNNINSNLQTRYSNAIYLHDGNDIDNPLAALGTLIAGSLAAAIGDFLSGVLSFGVSVLSDSVGGILETTQTNQQDLPLTVEIIDPNGEKINTLRDNARNSNNEYDYFYYAFNAQSGDYRVQVEANSDVEYTVNTNGTVKDKGVIDDETTQQLSSGDTQTLTATVPSEKGESGEIEPDDSGNGGSEPGLPPNVARFDTDNDGDIEFGEVLDAISAYNEGDLIGGEPVSFQQVLEVISAYNTT